MHSSRIQEKRRMMSYLKQKHLKSFYKYYKNGLLFIYFVYIFYICTQKHARKFSQCPGTERTETPALCASHRDQRATTPPLCPSHTRSNTPVLLHGKQISSLPVKAVSVRIG